MTRPRRERLPQFTDRLPLGETSLSVSPFCLGIVWEEEAICAAFDADINFFFFSADVHWPLYEATRRGVARLLSRGAAIRDHLVMAVVCYVTQPEFCTSPFKEALDVVPGLETIDVLVAGGACASDLLMRLPILQGHRGRLFLSARAIGTTFHDRRAALLAKNHGLVAIAFVRSNPAHTGARADLFPDLADLPG